MLTTLPIHAVLVPGPKQLQLKVCAEGAGVAAGGDATGASEGTPSFGTGAANCAGPLGGGTGAR